MPTPEQNAMNTFETAADTFVRAQSASEFIHDGEIVRLTGRYARPIVGPTTALTSSGIVASLHVEVLSADKDAPKKYWVKFNDLKIIRSI